MIPWEDNTLTYGEPILGFDGKPIVWIDDVYEKDGDIVADIDGDYEVERMMNEAYFYEITRNDEANE